MFKAVLKALCLPIFLFCSLQVQAADARIAAAANLRHVLPELISLFEQEAQRQLAVSYAASGTITTQIEHGAPFDIFLSANPDYTARLYNAGLTHGETIHFADAQMVLFAADYSTLVLDPELAGLAKALQDDTLAKIAIANPIHAPYGQAAKLLLEQHGLWQDIQPYLISAENASQAVQFSLSSSVDGGFIPYSHVLQPQIKDKGRFVKLPAKLPQQAVLLTKENQTANQFQTFLVTEKAQVIFRQHGFLVGK